MIEVALAGWIYFEACGFELEKDQFRGNYALTTPAPNIKGFWVKKEWVMGIIDWRKGIGVSCSSIYMVSGEHPLHVIGTTDEVLEKLRN